MQLSKWLRPYLKVANTFDEMTERLAGFFNHHNALENALPQGNHAKDKRPTNALFESGETPRLIIESARSFFGTIHWTSLSYSEKLGLTRHLTRSQRTARLLQW